jgi:hypothetical protein
MAEMSTTTALYSHIFIFEAPGGHFLAIMLCFCVVFKPNCKGECRRLAQLQEARQPCNRISHSLASTCRATSLPDPHAVLHVTSSTNSLGE